jgi:hypothetical protein
MQAAGQQITEGVNAVTVSPGVKAAAQANAWIAKLQASVEKWKRNVGAMTLADWQNAMINRGIPAISAGVQAKSGNYQAFAAKFYPYLQTGVTHVKTMPKGTLADGIARATYMITYNSKYTGGNGRTP